MSTLHEQFPGGIQRDTRGEICYLVGDIFRSRNLILPLTVIKQLEQAGILLGKLSNLLQLEDQHLHVSDLLMKKEAVASVSLDGASVKLTDLYAMGRQASDQGSEGAIQAQHYAGALAWGGDYLAKNNADENFIRKIHEQVLQIPSGSLWSSDYRKTYFTDEKNLAARPDYIPPAPEYISKCMENIINYIHSENIEFPLLVKIALSHYQMITVQPFENYNAQTTRLLSTLLFTQQSFQVPATIPFSETLLNRFDDYNIKLTAARTSPKELVEWVAFFLDIVIDCVEQTNNSIHQALIINRSTKNLIIEKLSRKKKQGLRLLHFLFSSPYIQTKNIAETLQVSNQTAHNLLDDFLKLGIIREITGQKRNRIFEFGHYLEQF